MKYTLEKAIKALTENLINEVNTVMPARVLAIDDLKLTVRPLITKRFIDGQIRSYPDIYDVPLILPRTANAIIYLPVGINDQVLLLCSQRDISNYLDSIGTADDYAPASRRKYSINDAVAIPGLFPFNSQLGSVTLGEALDNPIDINLINGDSKIRLGLNDGIEITTAGTTINIDNSGAVTITGDITVNGTITADEVTANGIDLSTHVHGGVEPGAGTTGSPQ